MTETITTQRPSEILPERIEGEQSFAQAHEVLPVIQKNWQELIKPS